MTVDFLEKVPLFSDMDQESLEGLHKHTTRKKYGKDAIIVSENDSG